MSLQHKILKSIGVSILVISAVLLISPRPSVGAISEGLVTIVGNATISVDQDDIDLPKTAFGPEVVARGLRIVFGVAGGIAVIVITIAGFRYVLSRGEPQAIAQSKNIIIYALVGLVICIAAFSIISFVITRVLV